MQWDVTVGGDDQPVIDLVAVSNMTDEVCTAKSQMLFLTMLVIFTVLTAATNTAHSHNEPAKP